MAYVHGIVCEETVRECADRAVAAIRLFCKHIDIASIVFLQFHIHPVNINNTAILLYRRVNEAYLFTFERCGVKMPEIQVIIPFFQGCFPDTGLCIFPCQVFFFFRRHDIVVVKGCLTCRYETIVTEALLFRQDFLGFSNLSLRHIGHAAYRGIKLGQHLVDLVFEHFFTRHCRMGFKMCPDHFTQITVRQFFKGFYMFFPSHICKNC